MRVACLVAIAVASISQASALPRVVVTIDVESAPSLPLPEQLHAVCEGGTQCGLMEIADVLHERGLAGTFFLNVYEHRAWGKPVMRRIAEELQSAGQDVALHTHPQWAYDPARNGMDQYSLDEQTAIIRDGVRLLSEWTGRAVVAHRAGDYAADERTLEALRTNGIKVDSSLFFGRPSSALNELALPRNLVSSPGGMIEVPVSVYLRDERPRFLATHFPSVTSIRKVDCDWLEDEDTARAVIDSLVSADPQFIVVFLHSFSFTAGKEATGRAIENRHSRRILEAILDRVKEKGLEVVTMRDIAAAPPTIVSSVRTDVLPIVTTKVPIYRYAWHWWHFHRTPGKRALALASGFAGLVVLAVIVVIVSGRMRRRRRSLTPT